VDGVTSYDLGVSSSLLSVYDYWSSSTPAAIAVPSADDAAAAKAAAAADALVASTGTGESGAPGLFSQPPAGGAEVEEAAAAVGLETEVEGAAAVAAAEEAGLEGSWAAGEARAVGAESVAELAEEEAVAAATKDGGSLAALT
jgi:hypothetical protein